MLKIMGRIALYAQICFKILLLSVLAQQE